MSNKKAGRPAKLKVKDLKAAGYKFKVDELTEEEMDWMQNGIPDPDRPNVRHPAPDYLYYYKVIEGIEVKIFSVGPDLYYDNIKLMRKDQLLLIEKGALEQAKWAEAQKNLKDTQPAFDIELKEVKTDKVANIINSDLLITLKGGPLDGKEVLYNKKLPFYMAQYEVQQSSQVSGTQPAVKKVIAARYRRSKEDANIYEFDKSFI